METLICRSGPVDRAALRTLLESRGYRVLDASNPDEVTNIGSLDEVDVVIASSSEATQQLITQRRRTEEALRESEARLRNITDTVPDLIWELTPDAELRYANRAWCEYFGRDTLAPWDWRDVVHPDDLEPDTAPSERWTARLAQPSPTGVRLRRHDGEYRWFSSRIVPIHAADGTLRYTIGSSTDIHALKAVQVELDESQRRLVSALRAAGMGTWRWDVDADRLSVDASLAQLLGRDGRGFEGRSLAAALRGVVHPEDLELAQRGFTDAVVAGPEVEFGFEWRVLRDDGSVRWLASKGRGSRDPGDGRLMLTGVSIDITRSRALEDQLRQSQKMEAIGLLAGGVAHDFNNILTVVLAHASMLESHPLLPPALAPQLDEIAEAAERAASLTSQLLAFGRRQALNKQTHDLNRLIADVLTLLRRLLGEQIECVFEPASTPISVRVDTAMLTQVLLNLAVNARDAMPGGGQLLISAAIVEHKSSRWAELRVRDQGTGMTAEVLAHVFEPFFTTKQVGRGTGLGLATVYGIVRQHGGEIEVETTLGRGTCFQIRLPVEDERASQSSRASSRTPEPGRGETVLLVEDEPAVRSLVRAVLGQYGYVVLVAETGARALELWAAHSGEVDLLLTDVVLPGGLDGIELATLLRHERPELEVLLTSGYSDDTGSLEEFGFLAKPYDVSQLLAALRRALDGRS